MTVAPAHQADLSLSVEYRNPSSLASAARNARLHSTKQIDQLAKSIDAYGFIAPVIIGSDGAIVAGHGRVLAAIRLSLKAVPTICVEHLSPEQRRAYALADNKIAENARWDEAVLKIEIRELEALGLDMTIPGFETGEIDALVLSADGIKLDDETDADIPPLPQQPVSRTNDIWVLGDHEIICGNVLEPATLLALMREERAQVSFSDPPYNVRIQGHVVVDNARHKEFAMASGEMTETEFTAFLAAACTQIAAYAVDGSLHYLCIDWRHIAELSAAGRGVFSELKNICVWDKVTAGMGSLYRSAHELVFVFKLGTAPHVNNIELGRFGRHRTNVWRYPGLSGFGADRTASLELHPTVKPLALVRDAILDSTERGRIVLDAFAGSGTTTVTRDAEFDQQVRHHLRLAPGASPRINLTARNQNQRLRYWLASAAAYRMRSAASFRFSSMAPLTSVEPIDPPKSMIASIGSGPSNWQASKAGKRRTSGRMSQSPTGRKAAITNKITPAAAAR